MSKSSPLADMVKSPKEVCIRSLGLGQQEST